MKSKFAPFFEKPAVESYAPEQEVAEGTGTAEN